MIDHFRVKLEILLEVFFFLSTKHEDSFDIFFFYLFLYFSNRAINKSEAKSRSRNGNMECNGLLILEF